MLKVYTVLVVAIIVGGFYWYEKSDQSGLTELGIQAGVNDIATSGKR
jgi:hypothetical protein